MLSRKAQAAPEYIYLLAGVILVLVFVSLTTMNIVSSQGNQVGITAGSIATLQVSVGELNTPTPSPTGAVVTESPPTGCTPGAACSNPNVYCSLNGTWTCTGYTCDSWGVCNIQNESTGLCTSCNTNNTQNSSNFCYGSLVFGGPCTPPPCSIPCQAGACTSCIPSCNPCVPATPLMVLNEQANPSSISAVITFDTNLYTDGNGAWVEYWLSSNPLAPQNTSFNTTFDDNHSAKLTGLSANTSYVYRAWAQNGTQIVYGNNFTFATTGFSCLEGFVPLGDTCVAFPDFDNLCGRTNNCDLISPGYFDLVVGPNYTGSPTWISLYNTSPDNYCYDGDPICKPSWLLPVQCHLRGRQQGIGLCANEEDQGSDYDWNDFSFSARSFNFPSGDQVVEVMNEYCQSAAPNNLSIVFDFLGVDKYVRDLEYGNWSYGSAPSFLVFPNCQSSWEQLRRFYVTAANPPTNLPPIWSNMSNATWTNISVQIVGPGSSAIVNLSTKVSDDNTPLNRLYYHLVHQSNTTPVSCSLNGSLLNCTGLSYGVSRVTVSATDEQGLTTSSTFKVAVGLVLDLPPLWVLEAGGFLAQWYMQNRAYSPAYAYPISIFDMQFYSIVNETNATAFKCSLTGARNNSLTCLRNFSYSNASNFVTIQVHTNNGDKYNETIEVHSP